MNYSETGEFKKDLKKLSKKYRSLEEDLDVFKKVLARFPEGNSKHFALLVKTESCKIIKARLFSRYLKKNSLRIIYAYYEEQNELEFVGIEFIELYYKGNKDREDETRIEKYLNNL